MVSVIGLHSYRSGMTIGYGYVLSGFIVLMPEMKKW